MRSEGLSFRHRSGGSEWPTPWDRVGDRWPSLTTAPTTGGRPGAALTVCCRGCDGLELIAWDCPADALDAARELFRRPCGRGCQRRRCVLYVTGDGRLHVGPEIGDEPPPSRAALWRMAYPPGHRKRLSAAP
jgi:hypothetical protein